VLSAGYHVKRRKLALERKKLVSSIFEAQSTLKTAPKSTRAQRVGTKHAKLALKCRKLVLSRFEVDSILKTTPQFA